MRTMKSFSEFTGPVNENNSSKCMSESMHKKMNEMYESMCNEMKACHEDETPMTAENYMSECSEKLNEMMENMANECSSYMKSPLSENNSPIMMGNPRADVIKEVVEFIKDHLKTSNLKAEEAIAYMMNAKTKMPWLSRSKEWADLAGWLVSKYPQLNKTI